MAGSSASRTNHGALSCFHERCREFRRRVTRVHIPRLWGLSGIHHLRGCGEACDQALSRKGVECLRDLSAHDVPVGFPPIDQTEILQRSILCFDQVSLDAAERAILDRQKMTLTECEWIQRWLGFRMGIGDWGLGSYPPPCVVASLLRVPPSFGRGDRRNLGFGLRFGTSSRQLVTPLRPGVILGSGVSELSEELVQQQILKLCFGFGFGAGGWQLVALLTPSVACGDTSP